MNTKTIPLLALAVLAAALPASAATGPEFIISTKGEVHIIGVELTTVNAINLFSVNVWGLRWTIPIEKWTVLENAGGASIASTDILQGHRLEIKGDINPSRSGWLETRLIRDLSIGSPSQLSEGKLGGQAPPPPAPSPTPTPVPQTANVGAAVTPPPSTSSGQAPLAPSRVEGPAGNMRMLTQQLRTGMRGAEVVILQEFLQKNGWGIPDDGPVTGYYGAVTANAVRKFQAANGLPPEGEVGPKTRTLINGLRSKP